MKILVCLLLVAYTALGAVKLTPPQIKSDDLKRLTGAQWKGRLSYLDYRANKRIEIPSNLTVTQSPEDKSAWIFDYQYPDEPKANNKSTLKIGKDGKTLGEETVVERTELPDNTLRIVTNKNGIDNEKNAVFRYTYLLNERSFSIKKEVKYQGADEFFERNQYKWER